MLLKLQTKLYHRSGRNMALCRHGATVNDHGKLTNYIAKMKFINKTGFLASASLFMLVVAILAPIYNMYGTEPSEATTGTTNASSLTFTSLKTTGCSNQGNPNSSPAVATACVSLIPSGSPNDSGFAGTFATSTSTQKASFSISTTNYTGYTLTLKASSSTTLSNGTDVLNTINTGSPSTGITADTFTNDTNYNNSWGYSPSYFNGSVNSSNLYYGISTTHDSTLDSTSSPNTTAKSYTIGLGARADYSKSAGTYTNTSLVLAYIANPVNYVIAYNKNTTDTVTNMPYSSSNPQYTQKGDTSSTTITLANTVPVREGYNFKGWCSTQVADDVACTGTTFNPDGDGTNLSYGIDQTAINEKTIYAVWEKEKLWFQDATYADCGQNMYDNRGTTAYKSIAYTTKEINNLCWMTRNLDLPGGTTLSQSDSNLNGTTTSYALPNSSTSGFNRYAAYVYNTGLTNCSIGNCYSYYSYPAATAGTNPSSGDASSDICPHGWKLPTRTQFNSLVGTTGYDTGAKLVTNWRAVYAGFRSDSSFSDGGRYGYYWSSTVSGDSFAYRLYIDESSAGVWDPRNKNEGYSVRCVKEKTKLYFQNATSADCGETMYDNRGTDTYKSIAYSTKMVNGLCWMTRDLDLPGLTTLTQQDSNLNGAKTSYVLRFSSTSGFNDYETGWVYNSGSTTCNSSSACYSYYSYPAATAGTNPSLEEAASSDICPLGWRLPTKEEYYVLGNTTGYNTGNNLVYNWSGALSGYYYNGSLTDGGAIGNYWSSTDNGYRQANCLNFTPSMFAPNSCNQYKGYGYHVRCVAKS